MEEQYVHHQNPRDGFYFHQQNNDKRINCKQMKTKTFAFVVALKRAIWNGSIIKELF